jgi:hypothetical protein
VRHGRSVRHKGLRGRFIQTGTQRVSYSEYSEFAHLDEIVCQRPSIAIGARLRRSRM